MEKDDVRTVITGANFILPLPFTPRTALENHLTLLPNQDFEAYPNSSDAICELNILVESKSLPIQPIGDAAKRFFEANLKMRRQNSLLIRAWRVVRERSQRGGEML
jgi:hypothetical protein